MKIRRLSSIGTELDELQHEHHTAARRGFHVADQISGPVVVDLDREEVCGIISGKITKVGEGSIDFELEFLSNNYAEHPTVYRHGHLDQYNRTSMADGFAK